MRRLFFYTALTICSIIGALLFYRFAILPHVSSVHFENWENPYAKDAPVPYHPEWMPEHEMYRYAECNRRIRDQEYIACTWYKTTDPNVTVYLDLIEHEDWNAPVLYYTASDPNATIYLYQHLLMNASYGPIRWPEEDANDYAAFLDKKITLHSGGVDYDISKDAPMTVR